MLYVKRDRKNAIKITAEGDFEARHLELMSLICTMGNEAEADGLGFDEFLIGTMLIAKKLRRHATAIDLSKFSSLLNDEDIFDEDIPR